MTDWSDRGRVPAPAQVDTVADTYQPSGDAREQSTTPTTLPERSSSRYVLWREHARGGLGRVWRVFDRELGRELALKEALTDDEVGRQRFIHEAITTARLEHPSIVPVHDAGLSTETGTLFYTMKLVSGSTLAQHIAQAADQAERLAFLPRILAVAEAVGYAHSRGVIHRDLKPENVVVGTFGETIVIDWGLAKTLAEEQHAAPSAEAGPMADGLTRSGAVMGTPGYMSPEQASGEPVDARTDVYALGACLQFLVTGIRPGRAATPTHFDGAEHASVGAHRAPRDLLAIIRRATQPRPEQRYANAKDLADDLTRYLARQPVLAHRYSAAERVSRWVQRHRAFTFAVTSIVVLLGLGAALAGVRESVLRRAAETSTRSLLELQGRAELAAGRPRHAAVYLAEALGLAPQDPALKMLLSQAVKPLAAARVSLSGMARDVVSVDWSPDGAYIATGGDDEAVRVWRADTGQLVKAVTSHPKGIDVVAFSRDSQWLASGGLDNTVRVVNLKTLEETLVIHDSSGYRVAWTPDGQQLVVGSQSGLMKVYDAKTGEVRHTLTQHTDRAQHLSFSPQGELVVGSWDRTVSLWRPPTWEQVRLLKGFESEIASIAFSHDGRWAVIGESDSTIHVYQLPEWQLHHRIRTPEGSRFPLLTFSSDDAQVFARYADGVVRAWHLMSGRLLATIDVVPEGKLFSSAMRPDGKELVTAGLSGSAVIWSLEEVFDYRILSTADDTRPVMYPGTASASGWLALPDSSGKLQVWSANGGTFAYQIDVGPEPYSVAISDAAQTVLVTHATGKMHTASLRALSTGANLAEVPHPRLVMNVAVSRDGGRYATASYDGLVRLLDAKTGDVSATYTVSTDRLSVVAFSPDGQELAVAEGSGRVHFLNANSGVELRSFQPHVTWVQDLEYSPTGDRLVTAGRQDHHVKVWRRDDLALVHDWNEHTNNVMRATFSADGRRVASVGVDHQAFLWDATNGQLLRAWRGPSYTAEFIGGDSELLTTGYDGYAVAWSLRPDERTPQQLIDFVHARAPWKLVDGKLIIKAP